jgi:hypothetical protein
MSSSVTDTSLTGSSEISAQLGRLSTLDPSSDESISIIHDILPLSHQLDGQESQMFIDTLDKVGSNTNYRAFVPHLSNRP